jgi:hypothetical protein
MLDSTFHPDQEHFARAREWQAHYQTQLEPYGGGQVPAPVYGESTNAYRRKMCKQFKRQFLPQTHALWDVSFTGTDRIPSDALDPFENQLIEACKTEAYNPSTVPIGTLRQITKLDNNGHKIIEFVGQESFVKQMGIPGRRAKIRNPTTDPGWFPREVPSVWLTGR